MENQDAGWRGKLAGVSLALSMLTALWFGVAAIGSRLGWWSWKVGLGQMIGNVGAGFGRLFIAAALVLGLVAIIVSLIKAPRKRAFMLSLLSLVIAGSIAGRWMGFQLGALALPPIHDVQTDWEAPIMPTDGLVAKRTAEGAENPIEAAPVIPDFVNANWPGMGGKPVSAAQEEAEYTGAPNTKPKDKPYPKLDTISSPLPYEETFKIVDGLVKARGWEIITSNMETGRIEAVETSTFFGFKDDVLIRVSMVDGLGRVDVRSTSRVGLSDLGANAKRAGNLLSEISVALAAASPEPATGP